MTSPRYKLIDSWTGEVIARDLTEETKRMLTKLARYCVAHGRDWPESLDELPEGWDKE